MAEAVLCSTSEIHMGTFARPLEVFVRNLRTKEPAVDQEEEIVIGHGICQLVEILAGDRRENASLVLLPQ